MIKKIIDVHIHRDFSNELMNTGKDESKRIHTEQGLIKELELNKVINYIAIQIYPCTKDGAPIIENPIHSLKFNNKKFLVLAAINPLIKQDMTAYEELAKTKKIKGFKIYLGYYHFYPNDEIYKPYYLLAEKYNLIIMFHTGDNYSPKAKVKYAHPINIDEIAVDYPKAKFIIAHLGNPWLIDAAEVVYKNSNVYSDLSGLFVGELKKTNKTDIKRIKEALEYCGYERILYGSDWPLVPMNKYISIIKKIIPKKEQEKVFYTNAKKLFEL